MSTQDRFNQRLKESAMSEHKHEKGKGVIKEEYSLLFGETVTIGKKSYKELLQQNAELTKENERLKEALSEIRHALYARDTDDAILDCIANLLDEAGFPYESED